MAPKERKAIKGTLATRTVRKEHRAIRDIKGYAANSAHKDLQATLAPSDHKDLPDIVVFREQAEIALAAVEHLW
jgi:hypothetical protein